MRALRIEPFRRRVRQRVSPTLATVIVGLVTVTGITVGTVATAGPKAAAPVRATPITAVRPVNGMMPGIDVSDWQGDVRWKHVATKASFVYVKATEGIGFLSKTYAPQYDGAKAEGMYAGSYAFGRPDDGRSAAQADYFIDNASLSAAGRATDSTTLPPMLDIEWPYAHNGRLVAAYPCYGLTPTEMVAWIKGFVDEVKARTGSPTMIYTAAGWWNTCTGGSADFADDPLFVASYNKGQPHLPQGWTQWTIWQYSSKGKVPGDQNRFHGLPGDLAALAMPVQAR
jgi:GH25 family lysozyme M1 (1,4-beta-N-acetylmuramidase)